MLPLLRQQPACAQDLDYLKNGLCYETRIFPLGQQTLVISPLNCDVLAVRLAAR